MHIRYKKTNPRAFAPEFKTSGAAAADLHYCGKDDILVGSRPVMIPTGIAMAIPEGYVGRIVDRGSMFAKEGVHIGAGVIDSDFRGEIFVAMFATRWTVTIQPGQRIAQLMIYRVEQPTFVRSEELPETQRGEGMLASTGR